MKRTISVMLGKGSVSHNSRKFKAANIDSERTSQNITYCNEPIKEVYHELFDEALDRYNAKQKRADRVIDNYYEKIRTGKQEKLFYEVILQIGNKDDMAAVSEDGQLAAKVLDEYMKAFQNRNPNLHVFSAHLHMDEATPHLHIDFVPFTKGSKRGLDTRISLKQALAAQGFIGGARGDTEWSQWVRSEKEQLSQVMERHDIEWHQLGTYDEHLSVMNYKKEQRAKEVAELDVTLSEKQNELERLSEKTLVQQLEIDKYAARLENVQDKFKVAKIKGKFVAENARRYDDDPEFQLPEPKPLMSAKAYHEKVAVPLVAKLKNVIRSILLQFFDKTRELRTALDRANGRVDGLTRRLAKYEEEIPSLREMEKDYHHLRRGLGEDAADRVIGDVKTQEAEAKKNRARQRSYQR
nr:MULTISPECIES: plasmid recombination protein [Christensenella]